MSDDLAERVARYPFWYHSIDLGGGVVTPGEWDLRAVLHRLPWPDVRGRRCLDVGTFDGMYAFELERRGAAEVVAVDIDDWGSVDLPLDVQESGDLEAKFADTDWTHGGGFAIAHEALRSSVRRQSVNVYDLSPEVVGTFDVVTCGSLLLHLRDPVAALSAIRSVCTGTFMSVEAIDPVLTTVIRRWPVARFVGQGTSASWWIPNAAGHRAWLRSAGFTVGVSGRPFVLPQRDGRAGPGVGRIAHQLWGRAVGRSGDWGALHQAVCAQ